MKLLFSDYIYIDTLYLCEKRKKSTNILYIFKEKSMRTTINTLLQLILNTFLVGQFILFDHLRLLPLR